MRSLNTAKKIRLAGDKDRSRKGDTDSTGDVGCGHDEHVFLRLDLVKLSQKGIDDLIEIVNSNPRQQIKTHPKSV